MIQYSGTGDGYGGQLVPWKQPYTVGLVGEQHEKPASHPPHGPASSLLWPPPPLETVVPPHAVASIAARQAPTSLPKIIRFHMIESLECSRASSR